jgi:arsenate reductase
MAEAIVNAKFGDRWEAFSAGSHPTWNVHPLTIKALAEIGITHQGRSKSVDEFRYDSFNLVVTLCESADEECPIWLGRERKVHLPFPDPASVKGDEAHVMAAFRIVRDRISKEVIELLRQ